MFDLAIRGGTVIDGTGARRRPGDVGIVDGRIADLGPPGTLGAARRDIVADGLIVAPGFVDVHSHFDAQVFWDPTLSPSSLHGVTTTISGNCGFTLAPLTTGAVDYLVRMLAVVEGMPLDALQAAVPGDWQSTGGFLQRIDGTLAINAGFLVGHSAMRRVVMGEDATRRAATVDELAAMVELLRDGLASGGLGFSSSRGAAHFDSVGSPVPSRFAGRDELVTLAAVCREFEGTSLEFIPNRTDDFDDEQLELFTSMSAAAARPINWNVIRIGTANAAETERVLSVSDHVRARGGKIVALNMPIPSRSRFTFRTGFVLDALPGWGQVMSLPLDERRRALLDPEVRAELRAGASRAPGTLAEIAEWGNRLISETFSPLVKKYEGCKVADIAAAEGKHDLDALLDIVCADGLLTQFSRPPSAPSRDDWIAARDAWRSGRAMIGASDAGAHLDFTAYFDYPVYIIEHAVREHGVLALEEAVHLMTDVPARLYGLRDRGQLQVGSHADVVIFDEDRLASGALETRFDLPAGAGRLYAEPVGVEHVLVNGVPIVTGGKLGDARPGTLLRSGRDTFTPDLG